MTETVEFIPLFPLTRLKPAVLCGSTTAGHSRKPQMYREDREGTVLTAIRT